MKIRSGVYKLRKIVNNADPGLANVHGGDDTDYINKLLTGIDQSASDPVDINTDWRIRDGRLKVRNPANTFSYSFRGSAITASRDLTLPLLTANDTIVTNDFAQTLTNKTMSYASNTQDVQPKQSIRKYGAYALTTATGGDGLWNSYLTSGIGTYSLQMSDSAGLFAKFTTGAVSGNQSGVRTNSTATRRIRNGTLRCKFAINQTTLLKFFIGFYTGSFIAGTTPLANIHGFGLWGETGASANYRIVHNAGDATQTSEDLTTPVAISTQARTLEIKANDSIPNYVITFDGSNTKTITTDIPASGQGMTMNAYIETLTAAARDFDIYWLEYEDGIGA